MSRQDLILKPMTYQGDEKILSWQENEFQGDSLSMKPIQLRRNATYEPIIEIHSRLLLHKQSVNYTASQIVHKCYGIPFTCNFWYCKDGSKLPSKIPSIGVCNGTSECGDGSDESSALCKGKHAERNYIILGLSINQSLGLICIILGAHRR